MSLGMALQLAALASHVTAAGAAGPPGRCGNSTTFCPAAADCCAQPYSPSKFGCKASNPANVSEGCGDGMDGGAEGGADSCRRDYHSAAHHPLPAAGVSTVMERGCQQNDSLANG